MRDVPQRRLGQNAGLFDDFHEADFEGGLREICEDKVRQKHQRPKLYDTPSPRRAKSLMAPEEIMLKVSILYSQTILIIQMTITF